ncbi:alpha/beta fold hydrolase [Kribbella turkmenica]|uniref:alpha/beta fold hydrolase n=1 Tax=Kribbella turkmenica TaxID=2530375 RepID=UPI0038992D6E
MPGVLVGHSLGALISLTYAAQRPQQLAGSVLVDATDIHLNLDIENPARSPPMAIGDHLSFDVRLPAQGSCAQQTSSAPHQTALETLKAGDVSCRSSLRRRCWILSRNDDGRDRTCRWASRRLLADAADRVRAQVVSGESAGQLPTRWRQARARPVAIDPAV